MSAEPSPQDLLPDADLSLFERKEDWLRARGRLLTSSRGPSVVGVGYGSAFRLNLELRGRALPVVLEGDGLEIGKEIEPAMLRMLRRRVEGLKVWTPAAYTLVRSREFPWLGSSPDGFAEHPDLEGLGVVELKSTAMVRKADWIAPDGSTIVPPYPRVQANHHGLAAGVRWCVIACQVGLGISARFVWRVLKIDQRWLRERYLPQLEKFWAAVEADEDWPADAHAETGRTLRDLYPKECAGKTITLPDRAIALVDEYEHAGAQKRAWTEAQDEAKARLQALMGDAETGLVDSERYVQWRVGKGRSGYVVAPSKPRTFRVRRTS